MTTGQRGTPPGPILPPPLAAPPRIDQLDDEAARSILGPRAMLAAGAILIVLLIVAIWIVFELGRGGDSSTRNESGTATSSSDSVTPMNQQTAATTDSTATMRQPPRSQRQSTGCPRFSRASKAHQPGCESSRSRRTACFKSNPDVKPADPSRDTPAKPSASDRPLTNGRITHGKSSGGRRQQTANTGPNAKATAEGRLAGPSPFESSSCA